MNRLIILLLLFFIIPGTVGAAAKRPADIWSYYHFDGSAFNAGPATDGSAFVAIREKARPVVLSAPAAHIETVPLPAGSGVIAGICYLQQAGGKLGGGTAYKPYPRIPLLISSGGKQLVTVQTDDNGYFVVVLPAGTYAVGSEPFSTEITVERGITTLVPLRAGKRMVD